VAAIARPGKMAQTMAPAEPDNFAANTRQDAF